MKLITALALSHERVTVIVSEIEIESIIEIRVTTKHYWGISL